MPIVWVQAHLEAIYGLRCEMQAHEYVVDRSTARALGGRGHAEEELLLLDGEDGSMNVALFLAPELLARLQARLDGGTDAHLDLDLDGYCQLVEGVSHFLYLSQVADTGRTVSLLELEAQAEVDKFASCVLSRWGEGQDWAQHIHRQLFDLFALREELGDDERWRYQEANRLARAYCGRLLPLVGERQMDRFLARLRYAYRLGADAKFRHLAQAA